MCSRRSGFFDKAVGATYGQYLFLFRNMLNSHELSAQLTALLQQEGLDSAEAAKEIRPVILALQQKRAKEMKAVLMDATEVYPYWKLPIPAELPPVPDPKEGAFTWYDPGLSIDQMIRAIRCRVPDDDGECLRGHTSLEKEGKPGFKRFNLERTSVVKRGQINKTDILLKTKRRRAEGERIASLREVVSLLLTMRKNPHGYRVLGSDAEDSSFPVEIGAKLNGNWMYFGRHWAESEFEIGMVEDVGEQSEEALQRGRQSDKETEAILRKIRAGRKE